MKTMMIRRTTAIATLLALIAVICTRAGAADFPDYPSKAIQFQQTDRVEKGRFAGCILTVNPGSTVGGVLELVARQ